MDSIDIEHPVTIADLLEEAGVPEYVPLTSVRIVYAGCGSHGIQVGWEEE